MVTGHPPPERCMLCNETTVLGPAGFRQIYRQAGTAPLYLHWWECARCRGWFVSPVPSPEEIALHCNYSDYNDPSKAKAIARAKELLQRHILDHLANWTPPGPLLDVGCSFGEFLLLARQAGWTSSGFDPNGEAVRTARDKGFDVRDGWTLTEAGFPEKHFAALTAIDSFCFVWHPFETLRTFYRLLVPGGVLAMRLTNKRSILGLMRTLSASGPTRDSRLSGILKGQFHAIGLSPLVRILHDLGFARVTIEPWATTSPWNTLSRETRVAYSAAQLLYVMTLKKVNLSPGILLFAQKTS